MRSTHMPHPKKHVLIVDDEEHVRDLLGILVKREGCGTIHYAANGDEAIVAVREHKPHLVLLDIAMPGKTGIETLRELKRANPACKVVMLTAMANVGSVYAALEAGADDYLLKNSNLNYLLSYLDE